MTAAEMDATAKAWIAIPFHPVSRLLKGDEDGSVQSSIVLRNPVSGNPEAAGHAENALASAGHFASLRGGIAAAGRGPSPVIRLHVTARA